MITRRCKFRLFSIYVGFAALFAATSVAHAVLFTGEGNDTLWSNPANWGPKGQPAATYPSSGSAEIIDQLVDLDVSVEMDSVTLSGSGNGGTIRGAGGHLGIRGALNIANGGFYSGPPTIITINAGAAVNWEGGYFNNAFTSNFTMNNAGEIRWSRGPVFFDGTLNNDFFGTFFIDGDFGFGSAYRTGVINNSGRIIKRSGNGVAQFSGFTAEKNSIDTRLNNDGAILVASGTLEIGSGTTKETGHWEIGDQHFLLVSGPYLFDEGTSFEGTGTVLLSNTEIRFAGHIPMTVTLELSNEFNFGGFRTGNGSTIDEATFHGPGKLVWGGDPRGSAIRGKLTLDRDFRTVTLGGGNKFPENLINLGTMTWGGGGPIGERGAFFRNEGTLNVSEAGTFLGYGSTFENAGTVNTYAGTSASEAGLFQNEGVVNIGGYGRAGILDVRGGRFTQTATGALYMEIGGTDPAAPEFDYLIGGVANPSPTQIGGALVVELIDNYTLPKDARLTLINQAGGKFARVFTPGGTERTRIEYEPNFGDGNFQCVLVSLSDAPIPLRLWGAGRDLARNETPDRDEELAATNTRVPQWSYGYRSAVASTALTLFTPEQHINDASGLHGWIGAGQATLAVNTKHAAIIFNTGSGDYKPLFPDQIYMAPGSGNEFLVTRWTAPEAGDYRVLARWADLDKHGGNGATAYVVSNGSTIFEEVFQATDTVRGQARLLARVLSLNAGDTLDFVVGSNGEHLFDATAFNAAVRRVPHVTITAPAKDTTVAAGQPINVSVAVDDSVPVSRVTLFVDGRTFAEKSSPPYDFAVSFDTGEHHYIRAEAGDTLRAPGLSDTIKLRVTESGAASLAHRAAPGASDGKAATAGKTYYCSQSGFWEEPSTWGLAGVPGINDSVVIGSAFTVTLTKETEVQDLECTGKIDVASFTSRATLRVYGICSVAGELGGPMDFILPQGATFFTPGGSLQLRDVMFYNDGDLVMEGTGVVSERSLLINKGTIDLRRAPGTEQKVNANFGRIEHNGGKLLPGPNVTLSAPAGVKINAPVELTPGYAISDNGAGLISDNGAPLISEGGSTLISEGGSTLVGLDGASLVGLDGASLVGLDGASLSGPDGAPLVGLDGASLISQRGGGLHAPKLSRSAASAVSSEADDPQGIVLAGGVITGTGELRGDVINEGAYISPGNSAGAIVVNGNYTQQTSGTLVVEIGGKTFPSSYDVFQVAGTATLGGNLVVKTISNYAPAAADSISPLLYGSATGNFASVSSNAVFTLNPTGMETKLTGPNPAAPKALNISTRMRVETGDNALIAGFIITGNSSKKVIIRGIGPSLPLSTALADTTLSLDGGAVFNDNWKSDQQSEIEASTIPPQNELESAIVATLAPGPHSAILRGKDNSTGVGLVEVYDLESGTPVQLANISTRGLILTGDDVMIGGFIIGGTYPAKVVLRGIGPSLPVNGALQDPELELHDANGGTISNDNWRATQEAEITATQIPPTDDREPSIVATLPPGAYSAVVRGKDNTTGIGLVEAYNLQ